MSPRVKIRTGVLSCPRCYGKNLHQRAVDVFIRAAEDSAGGTAVTHRDAGFSAFLPMSQNPSSRRDGIRIAFDCEACHLEDRWDPLFLTIVQHKGETLVEWETL